MLTNEQKKQIDHLFSLWEKDHAAGAQLCVVHKGETVYEQCYHYADIEEQVPITQDSLFSVASVSKQIVAMSIMILHDRGIISIHDDIRKYVPELVQFSEPVTISHMLHHTSGLREIFELTSLNTPKEGDPRHMDKLRMLAGRQKSLNFEPGSHERTDGSTPQLAVAGCGVYLDAVAQQESRLVYGPFVLYWSRNERRLFGDGLGRLGAGKGGGENGENSGFNGRAVEHNVRDGKISERAERVKFI
jgi:hypothetical protein